MSLMPGRTSGTNTRFYARTVEGAWVESDHYGTIEEARTEASGPWWQGRKTVIIKIETTETIVEEV